MTDELEPKTENTNPLQEALEQIQFGDSRQLETQLALDKAIRHTMSQAAYATAQQRELARSNESVKRFEDANPSWAQDEMTRRAVTSAIIDEERKDLSAIMDLAKYEKETLGRPMTSDEVANAHLHFRTLGDKRARPVETLFDDGASRFESWSGRRRESAVRDPSDVLLDRVNASRRLRGLPPKQKDHETSRQDDFSSESLQDVTRRLAGFGPDSDSESTSSTHDDIARHSYHGPTGREGAGSSVVELMQQSRRAPRVGRSGFRSGLSSDY